MATLHKNKTRNRKQFKIAHKYTTAKYTLIEKSILVRAMCLCMTLVLISSALGFLVSAETLNETPELSFTGTNKYNSILNNIMYTDVVNGNSWAKPAILEVGALEFMKGYGDKLFGLGKKFTYEQALALLYNSVGREKEAQLAAEALEQQRAQNAKKTIATKMWSDGYLQLALNDGIITQAEYDNAFKADQLSLKPEDYHRNASISREDMAYYAVKIFGLQPQYGQTKVFNSYKDWQEASPLRVPFIETVLKEGVMNGSGNGLFDPLGQITREQAAQIIKNSENHIFSVLNYKKNIGSIEKIEKNDTYLLGEQIESNIINIRNSNGKLHKVLLTALKSSSPIYTNEISNSDVAQMLSDVIVYKNGSLGTTKNLRANDQIEYIVDSNNQVLYINVVSSGKNEKYLIGKIIDNDINNNIINIYEFAELKYPDATIYEDSIVYDYTKGESGNNYLISENANVVLLDKKFSNNKDILKDMDVIITVSNNVITKVSQVNYAYMKEKGNVVGIVQENNPELGYITLFFENGSGVSPVNKSRLIYLRTFNYSNPDTVEVLKNHREVSIDNIEEGDTVFIKLDEEGSIKSISASDNYYPRYATVKKRAQSFITVQYSDGTFQNLEMNTSIPVFKGNAISSYKEIYEGDRVKLLVNQTLSGTDIKQIAIEEGNHLISGIYKAEISYLDEISDKVVLYNKQQLKYGKWQPAEQKGISSVQFSERYKYEIPEGIKGKAYFAVENDYSGKEKIAKLALVPDNEYEYIYDDYVRKSYPASEYFELQQEGKEVSFIPESIIVKNDRLVEANSVIQGDSALVVANRNPYDEAFKAGIIKIDDILPNLQLDIYRGRINEVNDGVDFTVSSFSQLVDLKWSYANTPKTFNLSVDTTVLDESGIVNNRDFVNDSDVFVNNSVYVIADGVNAMMISRAPYGEFNFSGEISVLSGLTKDSFGSILTQPDNMVIKNAKYYNPDTYMWEQVDNLNISIRKDSVILKNGELIKASQLEQGQKINIIKKDEELTGDAFIIIVE